MYLYAPVLKSISGRAYEYSFVRKLVIVPMHYSFRPDALRRKNKCIGTKQIIHRDDYRFAKFLVDLCTGENKFMQAGC